MATPIIRLKCINREYDGIRALSKVTMEVERGEILSIIGPNGSGKTTLLRILAMLDRPSSGEVFYMGKKVHDAAQLRRKVTMVFQKPVLFDGSVLDNVMYGLNLRDYSGEESAKRVKRSLKTVRLNGFGRRMARKLSGGEQQRVVLARAIALEPELLILDEPTSNLDPTNATIFENTIKHLKGRTTIVLATHNLFQARRISDRVGCILDGGLVEVGKTKEIFTHPKHSVTKKFIRGEFF